MTFESVKMALAIMCIVVATVLSVLRKWPQATYYLVLAVVLKD
jgi:hypothetical protein